MHFLIHLFDGCIPPQAILAAAGAAVYGGLYMCKCLVCRLQRWWNKNNA